MPHCLYYAYLHFYFNFIPFSDKMIGDNYIREGNYEHIISI